MAKEYLYILIDLQNPNGPIVTSVRKDEEEMAEALTSSEKQYAIVYYVSNGDIAQTRNVLSSILESMGYVVDAVNGYKRVPFKVLIDAVNSADHVVRGLHGEPTSSESKPQITKKTSSKKKEKRSTVKPGKKKDNIPSDGTKTEVETQKKHPWEEYDNKFQIAETNLALLESIENAINDPEKVAEAIEINEKAAEEGNVHAYDNLGLLYSSALNPEFSDTDKAIYYYEKAIETGFYDSCISLADLYRQMGRSQDALKVWDKYMDVVESQLTQRSRISDGFLNGVANYIIGMMLHERELEHKDMIKYLILEPKLRKEIVNQLGDLEISEGEEIRRDVVRRMKQYDFLDFAMT